MTQFLNNRDYNETEATEQRAPDEVSVFPQNPSQRRMVFKVPEKCLYIYYGTEWLPMCGGGSNNETPTVVDAIVDEAGDYIISESGDNITQE